MKEESELSIQGQLYQYVYNVYPQVRGILHHIPNGGKRTQIEASQLKASGVIAGVCDLFLPMARRDAHGMYVEMKLPGQKLKPEQTAFVEKIKNEGYIAYRIDDLQTGINLFSWYLGYSETEPVTCKL